MRQKKKLSRSTAYLLKALTQPDIFSALAMMMCQQKTQVQPPLSFLPRLLVSRRPLVRLLCACLTIFHATSLRTDTHVCTQVVFHTESPHLKLIGEMMDKTQATLLSLVELVTYHKLPSPLLLALFGVR
jgi:hypothetical protein